MMFQEPQDQVQRRAGLLPAGRFEYLNRECRYPLPVCLENHLLALWTPAEGIDHAAAFRDILQQRQIETLTITVKAVERPRSGRFRVHADWLAVSRTCNRLRLLQLTCFMRDTDPGIRSEMLHYHSPVHPDSQMIRQGLRQA